MFLDAFSHFLNYCWIHFQLLFVLLDLPLRIFKRISLLLLAHLPIKNLLQILLTANLLALLLLLNEPLLGLNIPLIIVLLFLLLRLAPHPAQTILPLHLAHP